MKQKPFRAIIEWDPNLPAGIVIYPLGGSDERDDKIRTILEQALTSLQAEHAEIQEKQRVA